MTGFDIANAIFSLLIVLGMIGTIAWLVRRWGGLAGLAGKTLTKSARRLAVIENLSVGARHRLVLIKRDDREYLVLLGPSGDLVIDNHMTAAVTDDRGTPFKDRIL